MNKTAKIALLNLVIPATLTALLLVLKKEVLTLPYHWDELGAYIPAAHWLFHEGIYKIVPGFYPPDMFYGHPPGIYFVLALLYSIFGEHIWVSHGLSLSFSALALIYTYRLGKQVAGELCGVMASLFLLFSPLFFAQSGMFLGDIPLAAFGTVSLFYVFNKNFLKYLFSTTFLLFSKESAIFFFPVLVGSALFLSDRPKMKNLILHSAPFLLLGIFFTTQRIMTGEWLPNPYFSLKPLLHTNFNKIKEVGSWIFVFQERWVLTMLLPLALFGKRRFVVPALVLILSFWGAFSLFYFLPRYILPTLPFLCILAASTFAVLSRFSKILGHTAVLAVALLLFVRTELRGRSMGSCETDMSYRDVIDVEKAAAQYLEENYPSSKIVAGWPLSSAYSEAYLGFVTEPLTLVTRRDPYDLVVYTPFGGESNKDILSLIQEGGFSLLSRFEKNGKFVEIFKRKG